MILAKSASWLSEMAGKGRYVAAFLIFGATGALWLWAYSLASSGEKNLPDSSVPAKLEFSQLSPVWHISHSTFVPGKPFSMTVVYGNNSGGLARQVKATGVVRIISQMEGRVKQQQEWTKFYGTWLGVLPNTLGIELGPNREEHLNVESPLVLTEDEARNLRDEQSFIHFFGSIVWQEETGFYQTNICRYYRPSVTPEQETKQAYWYECGAGHNDVRAVFTPVVIESPKNTASIAIEVMPVVDLSSRLVYYVARMKNTGGLTAKKVNRITETHIFRSDVSREVIDQKFITFEKLVDGLPLLHNDLAPGVGGLSARTLIPDISFDEMLDIQAGTKALYIFMIAKYQDERHELLMSKLCISYKANQQMSCDAHNETP